MIKIAIRVPPHFLQLQIRLIEELVAGLKHELPVPYSSPEPDKDLEEAWRESLLQDVEQDLNCLLRILGKKGLGTRPVSLEETEVDAILRACSAVRLKIREAYLEGIPEAELENGMVDPEKLAPREQGAFEGYLFLAALQDYLLSQLEE